MSTGAIGPNFANELGAASLTGLPFAWTPAGALLFGAAMTAPQITAVEAVYAAHDPTKPDPNAQYAAALAAGLAIVSTGTPALNATYGIAQQDEINLTALQVAVGAGVFPGYCRDINGNKVTMTGAQFTAIATAILDYIAAFDNYKDSALAGQSATAPSAPVTIA